MIIVDILGTWDIEAPNSGSHGWFNSDVRMIKHEHYIFKNHDIFVKSNLIKPNVVKSIPGLKWLLIRPKNVWQYQTS